ncbi:MAG: outer membrane protein assembly factor BamE [Alteromonadaceae bacterium]|nr:outer membrane protein assembly factor BamE [Alteromonadaceae bacterium]
MLSRILTVVLVFSLVSCSNWVFRRDIPQGNYLEQKDINKLQIAMTKEQVKFILGSPVLADSFSNDTWHYVYKFKSGRSTKFDAMKKFIIQFKDEKVVSASGDFEIPESFYTPMIN